MLDTVPTIKIIFQYNEALIIKVKVLFINRVLFYKKKKKTLKEDLGTFRASYYRRGGDEKNMPDFAK